MTNTDIVYRYLPEKGPRAPYVVGAPARDIAEWELVADPELAAIVEANIKTGGAIYAKVEPAKVAKVNKVAKVEEGE